MEKDDSRSCPAAAMIKVELKQEVGAPPAMAAFPLVKERRSDDAESLGAGLPEIMARMLGRTVLLKIHCENRSGAIVAALSVVESVGLTVTHTNVLPFTASHLDITIMATAGEGFSVSAQHIVSKLSQAFESMSSAGPV